MNIFKTHILLLSVLFILFFSKTVLGFNEDTHELINKRVAEITLPNGFLLNDYLINQLGFTNGIEEIFDNKEVVQWLELGGRYEDLPAWYLWRFRSKNHFHDPITNEGYSSLLLTGKSSIEWALMDQYTQSPGGHYSWNDVIGYYHEALTSPDKEIRSHNFAETFRGLGQLMHHVQDASSPAHTRNDQHPEYNYETWVKDNKIKVEDFSAYTPIYFNGAMDSFSYGLADSMASFIDTNQYDGTNPDVTGNLTEVIYDNEVFKVSEIGLSEYANANFFSNETNAIEGTTYTYPQIPDDPMSDPTHIENRDYVNQYGVSYPRQYYKKDNDGETNNNTGYLLSAVDYLEYYRKSLNPLGRRKLIVPLLDYHVYGAYADLLLPRAIGYSAGLLEYFFRGEIEVDILNTDTITITNNSSEDMDGIFTLYYDATDGTRKSVSNGSWYLSLQPVNTTGDTSNELSFTEPTDIVEDKRYILVFKGRLGSETGAVVGKAVKCPLFTATPTTGSAPLVVTFSPNVGSQTELDNFFYDFGDGSFSYVIDSWRNVKPRHIYANAGTYTPTVHYSDTLIWENLPLSVFKNLRGYRKNGGEHSTEAAAWAAYSGQSWQPGGVGGAQHNLRYFANPDRYWYYSTKFITDIDLTAYDGTIPIYLIFAFRFDLGLEDIQSGGVTTSLGGNLNRLGASSTAGGGIPSMAFYRLLDLTNYAGTYLTDVEIGDNTGYERKTIIPPSNHINGWKQENESFRKIHRILPSKCSITRENYITVTE